MSVSPGSGCYTKGEGAKQRSTGHCGHVSMPLPAPTRGEEALTPLMRHRYTRRAGGASHAAKRTAPLQHPFCSDGRAKKEEMPCNDWCTSVPEIGMPQMPSSSGNAEIDHIAWNLAQSSHPRWSFQTVFGDLDRYQGPGKTPNGGK